MNISAKRLEGETYNDYKARRKAGDRLVKAYLRGRRVKHTRKELIDRLTAKAQRTQRRALNPKSKIQNPK